MDKRAWTARGKMTEADKDVVQALVEKNKAAARIFVTGEVSSDYIGEAATRLLVSINDTLYKNGAGQEPLFTETRTDTIRMTRFDPEVVWGWFSPDTLVKLVEEEILRLGVIMDARAMDHFDFYESMVAAIKEERGEDWLPAVIEGSGIDTYYNAVYLSSLLLFGKPGYMDVPVAEHFAYQPNADFLISTEWNGLNEVQKKEAEKLRKEYGDIKALTNHELKFIVDLYAGVVQ
jgi:hypothetical protein